MYRQSAFQFQLCRLSPVWVTLHDADWENQQETESSFFCNHLEVERIIKKTRMFGMHCLYLQLNTFTGFSLTSEASEQSVISANTEMEKLWSRASGGRVTLWCNTKEVREQPSIAMLLLLL